MTEIQLAKLFPYTRVINPFRINPHAPDKWFKAQHVCVKFHNVDGTKFACMSKFLPCPLCEMGHENIIYKHFTIYITSKDKVQLTDSPIHSVILEKPRHDERESQLGAFVAAVDKRYGNPYSSKVFKLMSVSPPELVLNSSTWFSQLRAELQLIIA